ncbi:MAG TPA: CBS domain-containing protein [Nitrosopumilaceae archaeon]|nr:CBS domain-containing protein [Nitrosopumilaceae archaeon]
MSINITDLKVADYLSPHPITISKKASFADAVSLMTDKGIGNLIIKDGQSVEGILTERELLRYLAKEKKIPDESIQNITASNFTKIPLETTLLIAAKTMLSTKSRILVFDNEKLIGIITASDMLRGFRKTNQNPTLEEVMSKKIYQCSYNDTILKAVKLMHLKRIGSVIVTKDKKPYGIFTERDLLVNVLANEVGLDGKVGGYCSSPLVTARVGIGCKDASDVMSENKIKRLVLVDDKGIQAVVTARDMVDAFSSYFTPYL